MRPRPDWISSKINSTPSSSHTLRNPVEVPGGRDDHAGLALDRLDQYGQHVSPLSPIAAATASNEPNGTLRKPAETGRTLPPRPGIGGEADDRGRTAVEVPVSDDDHRPVGAHPLPV